MVANPCATAFHGMGLGMQTRRGMSRAQRAAAIRPRQMKKEEADV
jgi:hypothetical protein